MATANNKSTSIFKIFVILFILIVIVAVTITVYIRTRPEKPIDLPSGSFSSRVVERTAYRPDGTPYKYFVINTTNNTSTDYYSCRQIVTASGTQNLFYGFVQSYTEPNCTGVTSGRRQYSCLMSRWYQRYKNHDAAQTYRKFSLGSNYDISVSSYYLETQPPAKNFTSLNKLNDIYSVTLNCNTSDGTPVTHTQIF